MYTPPTISAAGLTVPSYNDVVDYLTSSAQTIYGQSIYLGNDSPDFQQLSIFALALSDAYKALQLAYNNQSPVFAIGAGLSLIVKLNGLARKQPSYSTATVTLTGTAGTVIINGVVKDVNGNFWNLPTSVTIGMGGTASAVVTAQVLGAINATIGQISIIVGGTSGWTGVTNAAAASPGQPVEADSQLRARQAVSTELPALTTLDSTRAAILAVPGVTGRINIDENYTNSTNGNGNPAHSITCVVEGGSDLDVATAIFQKRGIGPLTNGTTSVTVIDPITNAAMTISFKRPTLVPIYVTIDVTSFSGYTSGTTSAILTAVVAYLNALQIGQDLSISGLEGSALAVMPDLTNPLFSITSLTAGTTLMGQGTTDISIAYDHVTQGINANVVINVT